MNYPVWQLEFMGGGLVIAMMAVFHVFISHFAIGGGLFLVITEMKAYREESREILDYVKTHTRFFLLITLVLGAITGVGIWFTIALINPSTTSILIHNFVFGWGIEWVFFLAEIISILIYYYTFGRMKRRNHLIIGWLYFAFAWLSLFIINGIIDFMLTPGGWLGTGNFWLGFFNPTFWPSLFFRTFLALMLAGLYGFLTATLIRDEKFRLRMVRYCALWLLLPFALFLAAAYWYVAALPEPVRILFTERAPDLARPFAIFITVSPLLFLGGLLMTIKLPQTAKKSLAAALMVIGLLYLGSFEYVREGSRRPYTIYNYIYSNSILKTDVARAREKGVLGSAKWAQYKEITDENQLAAGREIFYLACASCHSIGGPTRDIVKLTADFNSIEVLAARISAIGKIKSSMPPFVGTEDEQYALASYIFTELQKKTEVSPGVEITEQPVTVPPFDQEKDEYVLLAWSDKGIRAISDSDASFTLRPPGSDLYAMLIRRGELPEIITEGVTLEYTAPAGFENPAGQVDFWTYSAALTGRKLPANTGTSGSKPSGVMAADPEARLFRADRVPVVPYTDQGDYRPYPLFTITAKDSASGAVLAQTRVVAPVSTELGCRNCHGGPWRKKVSGIATQTAGNILAAHDRLSRTNLASLAGKGKPVRCQSCHPDPRTGKDDPKHLSLSAAIHGFHANLLSGRGADACFNCHGATPNGPTRFFRGIHNDMGFECTQCHGTIEDHALALLLAEKKAGKKRADRLIQNLKPKRVESLAEINPRRAWINEPDCLTCHEDFNPPETDTAFNRWTENEAGLYSQRTDDLGIRCAACHNAPHAVYPAINPYGLDRDNTVPMQYQGNPYPIGANKNCKLCHTIDMEDEAHHPNSLNMMRNPR